MIRKLQWVAAATIALLCAACDAHFDVPDTAIQPGHVLCKDGTVLSYTAYEQSGKRAIAVLFDAGQRKMRKGTAMRFTSGTLNRWPLPTVSALIRALLPIP